VAVREAVRGGRREAVREALGAKLRSLVSTRVPYDPLERFENMLVTCFSGIGRP
jgi:hypothetical protein